MWHNVRLLNAISNTFFAIFILAVGAGVIGWLIQKPVYALQTVRVQSADGKELKHVNALTVRNIALPNVKGNFFTVDLNDRHPADGGITGRISQAASHRTSRPPISGTARMMFP